MKNLIKRIFALALVVFVLFQIQNLTAQTLAPFPAKYSFVNGSEIGVFKKRNASVNEVIIPSEKNEYALAHFLPIPFDGISSSLQTIGLGKNHILMICICLSAFFLVLSHKTQFETDIYEFYHRTPTGEVLFESEKIAKTHELKSYMAVSLKILGVFSGLIAFLILVF
ncbi:hypothetical protein [Aquiflexum sp.]|uniref:hypothetical protein n=1 Tax=Aquiflexum sp. TaxID=1872584 RepID=UPI0035942160